MDDHPLVREGMIQLISRQADMVCCGETGSSVDLAKVVEKQKPDLVTIDIRLQNGDGLDSIKDLKDQFPSLLTMVISQCDEMIYAERALKAGARGYVMKERATDEVLAAMRTILAGELYVSPKVAALALHQLAQSKSHQHTGVIGNLSNRELQVLQLLGAGLSTRMVANKLGLSIKTIETHRENIKNKLNISNSTQLLRFATDWVNGKSPA
jgi:DNA-binding NarL/FixJ family response regulator